MQTLWFKSRFVASILDGSKRDTIRARIRLREDEVVGFSVGPRKPFATAKITKIEKIDPAQLPPQRKSQVEECVELAREMWRINFEIIESLDRVDQFAADHHPRQMPLAFEGPAESDVTAGLEKRNGRLDHAAEKRREIVENRLSKPVPSMFGRDIEDEQTVDPRVDERNRDIPLSKAKK